MSHVLLNLSVVHTIKRSPPRTTRREVGQIGQGWIPMSNQSSRPFSILSLPSMPSRGVRHGRGGRDTRAGGGRGASASGSRATSPPVRRVSGDRSDGRPASESPTANGARRVQWEDESDDRHEDDGLRIVRLSGVGPSVTVTKCGPRPAAVPSTCLMLPLLKTEKQVYAAGEVVTGTLCIEIDPQHSEATHLSAITLVLKGKEKIVTRDGEHIHEVANSFFERTLNVYTRPERISGPSLLGYYEFGIVYELPEDLPGTISRTHSEREFVNRRTDRVNHDVTGYLWYETKTRAFSLRTGIEREVSHHSSILTLVARPPRSLLPPRDQQSLRVVKCGCLPRGRVVMTASLDRSSYAPGDAMTVTIAIDNTSGDQVDGFRVLLVRTWTFREGATQSETHHETVHEQTFPGVVGRRTTRDMRVVLPSGIPLVSTTQASWTRLVEVTYRVIVEVAARWTPADVDIELTLATFIRGGSTV